MIAGLLRWYQVHCDGEWEHHHGFTIESADNPGVILRVDIGPDTGLDPDRNRMIAEENHHGEVVLELRVSDRQLVGFAAPDRVPDMLRKAVWFLGPSYS